MLISIYMPTHNRKALLLRALRSLQCQTYENIEIIICDDGSSDGTYEFLIEESLSDNRIIVLKNDEPKGACFSRNYCISQSRGEYITGIDDDDYFLPNRIEYFVKNIKIESNLIYCTTYIFQKNNHFSLGKIKDKLIDFDKLKNANSIGSQIFAEANILKNNKFDENAPAWQDYDLWFRILESGFKCEVLPLASYVMDQSHEGKRITTSSKAYQGYKYFINKHSKLLSKPNLNNLYFEDLNNRNVTVTFFDLIKHPTLNGLKKFIRRVINKG